LVCVCSRVNRQRRVALWLVLCLIYITEYLSQAIFLRSLSYHSSQVCIHHFSQTSWVHIVHIIYSSSFLVHRLYHNINCVYWYFPPDESHKVSVDSFHDWINDNSSFGSLIYNSNSKIVKGFYSHRILGIRLARTLIYLW
jgi:hypothetical protein